MFDPTTLVGFHTWLSLLALGSGVVVILGLISGRAMPAWTAVFLLTAAATSATGFALPFERVLPSHIVGGFALVALAVALLAQYRFRLAGAWGWLYAVAAIASVYLLVFVGVAQAFLKIPGLNALAPTGTEAPFAVAQLVVLAVFVAIGVVAVRTARRAAAPAAYARVRAGPGARLQTDCASGTMAKEMANALNM
jgi:hypothetical protein